MIKKLIKDRKIILELAKNDCKARFSSSILGIVWTILQPLVNMLVIWLVFQIGFKSSNLSGDIPFIIWYMPAFLIWNYFQEATSQSTNSMLEYSYLVKKVNFDVEVIPPIKIISNAFIHCFFIAFIIFSVRQRFPCPLDGCVLQLHHLQQMCQILFLLLFNWDFGLHQYFGIHQH